MNAALSRDTFDPSYSCILAFWHFLIPFCYLNLKKKNVTTRGRKVLHFKVLQVIFQALTQSPQANVQGENV